MGSAIAICDGFVEGIRVKALRTRDCFHEKKIWEEDGKHCPRFSKLNDCRQCASPCTDGLRCSHEVFLPWRTTRLHRALHTIQPCGDTLQGTAAVIEPLIVIEAARAPFQSRTAALRLYVADKTAKDRSQEVDEVIQPLYCLLLET